ncbi:hypothetical protein FRC00_002630, partial [Tulasnella sp. 408]
TTLAAFVHSRPPPDRASLPATSLQNGRVKAYVSPLYEEGNVLAADLTKMPYLQEGRGLEIVQESKTYWGYPIALGYWGYDTKKFRSKWVEASLDYNGDTVAETQEKL